MEGRGEQVQEEGKEKAQVSEKSVNVMRLPRE